MSIVSNVIDTIYYNVDKYLPEGDKLYIGVRNDGTVSGLDNPDGVALQLSNMVRDAIKPDVTMFLNYETIEDDGKKIAAVDIP